MPRVCTICHHKDSNAIDKAISADKAPIRRIATQYHVDEAAIRRHKKHLPKSLTLAAKAEEVAHADTVLETIRVHGERIQLLYDACDRYLRDPDDPTRYDLGPRDTDIMVIYDTWEDSESEGDPDDEDSNVKVTRRKVRKKDTLANLIADVPNIFNITYKIADPRELILKTAVVLKGQLEMIGQLTGELLAAKTLVQVNAQNAQVNIGMSPAIQSLVDELMGGRE